MIGGGLIQGGGGVTEFKKLSDTPASFIGQSGKTATVKVAEDGLEFTTPAGGGDMLAATYDAAGKAAQLLATSDLVTTIGNPGSNTKIPTEQGTREALNAIDQKKIKATYFATIASGTTSGSITKPAGNGADVDFIMDEWGTVTDALVSTIENGKPTFKSPVNAAGSTITTTFNTAGNYAFSDTPAPAADHAVIYVYTCYIRNFNIAETLWESELLDYVADHAASHTDGSDDIQSATAGQKGLATADQITKLDGIEVLANVTDAANVNTAGAVMEVDFNAATFLYAVNDDTPVVKTRAEVLALLSGQASASFNMNSQAITKLSNIVTVHTPAGAATATLDLDVSRVHDITMPAGNITIAVSNENNGDIFTIRILQDGTGSRTVTWFSTIKWAGGSAPTLTTAANKADTFIFRVTGTDTYDGFEVGLNT